MHLRKSALKFATIVSVMVPTGSQRRSIVNFVKVLSTAQYLLQVIVEDLKPWSHSSAILVMASAKRTGLFLLVETYASQALARPSNMLVSLREFDRPSAKKQTAGSARNEARRSSQSVFQSVPCTISVSFSAFELGTKCL